MIENVIAVDWSGALRGAHKRIWIAWVRQGRLHWLENGRTREQVAEWLLGHRQRYPDTVVGLDFAFAFPAWFVKERGVGTAAALWEQAPDLDGTYLVADPPRPFYRRGKWMDWARAHHESLPDLRLTDRDCWAQGGRKPESLFHLVGPRQVGPGSVRGMSALLSLGRQDGRGYNIWPFQSPEPPLVVEIYPAALYQAHVTKSSKESRQTFLEKQFSEKQLTPGLRDLAASTDDSFDAAVSALRMWQHLGDLPQEQPPAESPYRIEGQIWLPGVQPKAKARSERRQRTVPRQATVAELTKLVRTFCEARDWDQFHTPKDLAIGIATEAGELLELFRFLDEQESLALLHDPPKRRRIEDELADVLFFLLRFAQRFGFDLRAALESRLARNAERYPIEKARGSNKKATEL
jgi:NTP pyrophosphatase (non-canonical NTP hydrolase)